MDDDEILLKVIRRKVRDIPGETYMIAEWNGDLLDALELIGDRGEHADKLFALIEGIEEDSRELACDENEVSG